MSDAALGWWIEEATRIPDGLKVDGLKAPGDATGNPKLHLFPAAGRVQHFEIAGMRDTNERSIPAFLRRFSASWTWASQVRRIAHDAPAHDTVVSASTWNGCRNAPARAHTTLDDRKRGRMLRLHH